MRKKQKSIGTQDKQYRNKLGARTLGARSGGRSSNNLDMDKSFNAIFATRMAVAPFSNI